MEEDKGVEEGEGPEDHTLTHPLLNDVVLDNLVPFLHVEDVPNFRQTCRKWKNLVASRFRNEFFVDLTGHSSVICTRKMARFIYSMPPPGHGEQGPFDSFKISEVRLGMANLDRAFLTQIVPECRRLQLTSRAIRSSPYFWSLLKKMEKLEELEVSLSQQAHEGGRRDQSQRRDEIAASNSDVIALKKLWKLKWVHSIRQGQGQDVIEEEEEENGDFLDKMYRMVNNLKLLDLSIESGWKHLRVFKTIGVPRHLTSVHVYNLSLLELTMLNELSETGLHLSEFSCCFFSTDLTSEKFNTFIDSQSQSLVVLQTGWTRNRMEQNQNTPILHISFNSCFPKMEQLTLRLSSKICYQRISFSQRFPSLKALSVCAKDNGNLQVGERIFFLEDLVETIVNDSGCGSEVSSVWKLELAGVPLRNAESLHNLELLFPNVTSLTFGRPSKHTVSILWNLWPALEELKIICACPQIDEVLTGIPTSICRKALLDRRFDLEDDDNMTQYFDGSVPSIRNLKNLQRLEINGKINCKLQNLSCLPSDVSVYYAFMLMPELRRVLVHRSLISGEAIFNLQQKIPTWGTIKIEQIRFEFDETIDAFQFHRNNQNLMKILCQYPHQNLHMLPTFLTSLWMEGRLNI